jgi:hypothetical protein
MGLIRLVGATAERARSAARSRRIALSGGARAGADETPSGNGVAPERAAIGTVDCEARRNGGGFAQCDMADRSDRRCLRLAVSAVAESATDDRGAATTALRYPV